MPFNLDMSMLNNIQQPMSPNAVALERLKLQAAQQALQTGQLNQQDIASQTRERNSKVQHHPCRVMDFRSARKRRHPADDLDVSRAIHGPGVAGNRAGTGQVGIRLSQPRAGTIWAGQSRAERLQKAIVSKR